MAKSKVRLYVKEHPLVQSTVRIAKRIRPPGFDGIPLYDVALFFYYSIRDGDVQMRARSIAYSFFLALFPAIIFLFTLIPYLPLEDLQLQVLLLLKALLPPHTYDAAYTTIEDIISRQRGGLLSLGFIFALYFSTDGVHALIEGFHKTVHQLETRNPWKQRLVSVLLTLMLVLLVVTAIVLLIASEFVVDFLVQENILRTKREIVLLRIGKWIILLSLCFFAISSLYFFGPSRKEKFRFISAGGSLATLLIVLTTIGFNFFIVNFSQYNKIYGSIGTIIIIMVWLYINSMQLLLGFELNASISRARKRSKSGEISVASQIKKPE